MNEAKEAMRDRAKRNRAALNVDHARIRAGLVHFLAGIDEGWIVLFDAMPGEPQLGPLVEALPNRAFALTRTPEAGRTLTIHPHGAERERHHYGYSQPIASATVVPDEDIAAVMVPGLAFDRHGGRLGFGAGYYDRFLARLRPGAAIVGVSDGFLVERVPMDEHDIAMTHLATEAGTVALPLTPR